MKDRAAAYWGAVHVYAWRFKGQRPYNPQFLILKTNCILVGIWETMKYFERITVDPNQCGGRPCVRGMRIRVKDILDLLAAGVSRTDYSQGLSIS